MPLSLPEEFWITSLTSLCYTDLIASGSFNGNIHLWKSTPEFNHLTPLFTIEQVKFVYLILLFFILAKNRLDWFH